MKRRRRGKSVFKQVFFIVTPLVFTVHFLYSNSTTTEDSNKHSSIITSATNRPGNNQAPKILQPSQQDYVSVSPPVKKSLRVTARSNQKNIESVPIIEITPKDMDITNTYSLLLDSQELKNIERMYQKNLDSINPIANNVSIHE